MKGERTFIRIHLTPCARYYTEYNLAEAFSMPI